MCGIIGYIVEKNNEKNNFYYDKFKINFAKQNHRGPDFQQELNIEKNNLKINFGFNRLSIIDLNKSANKIFHNEKYYLLFNGEIYNHEKLKLEYLQGENFSTKTDTEILFKLLVKYGVNFLKNIEGIFSIAFLDLNNENLYLSRDYTGTKPLYYTLNKDGIFFSSEAWFQYSISDKKIDIESLNFYFKYGFSPNNKTLISNVKKIEAGTYSLFNLKKKKIETIKFFNLKKNTDSNLKDLNIKLLVENVIKKNLISDTKIGVFASGGLDSSLILMISKFFNTNIEAYTSFYSPQNIFKKFNIDLNYTRKICTYLRIKLNIVDINLDQEKTKLELISVFQNLDEPLPNLNFFNSYLQAKNAKENNCKVILTGDGGDEIFGGYQRYRKCFLANKLKFLSFLNNKLYSINNLKKEELIDYFYRRFNKNDFKKVIKNELQINDHDKYLNLPDSSKEDMLNYFDTKYWLSEESNFKIDRSTMLNSVEARVPFQDINLLKNIYSIPYKEKFSLFFEKKIIRNNFKNIPNFIKNRKKHGWFSPENFFLKNQLKDFFYSTFSHKKINEQNIFNYNELIKMFEDHLNNKIYKKSELMILLAFQCWYDQVLKS